MCIFIKTTRLLLFIIFFLWYPVAGAYNHLRQEPGNHDLSHRLQLILKRYHTNSIGIYVKSMYYGDSLYEHNINKSFVPASIMKLLTAETALLTLGENYRFQTILMTDAGKVHSRRNNGKLNGNLYLIQSGDPSFTYQNLNRLLRLLKSQKINYVAGNLYIDDSVFDRSYYGPGWMQKDVQYCYGAPISASIINHNCLGRKVLPSGGVGKLTQIIPHVSHKITDDDYSRNANALSFSYLMKNVLDYNTNLIAEIFRKIGVKIHGKIIRSKAHHDLTKVADHKSPPVKNLVNQMLKKSDNVIAGALFKKVGQTYTHEIGSWDNGSLAVKQILANKMGLNTKGFNIVDGSGLSRLNKITPKQMMGVLEFNFHNSATKKTVISSLPVAGHDGTLRNRMHNISYKVKAKTGSMTGVISLAGYAWSKNKEPLAFVIIINSNEYPASVYRSLIDKIATILTEYKR